MTEEREPELSWDTIEPGAAVFAFGGKHVGRVRRVVGDVKADIFTGVIVSLYGDERFIPSGDVRGIWSGEIEIDAARGYLDRLAKRTARA